MYKYICLFVFYVCLYMYMYMYISECAYVNICVYSKSNVRGLSRG